MPPRIFCFLAVSPAAAPRRRAAPTYTHHDRVSMGRRASGIACTAPQYLRRLLPRRAQLRRRALTPPPQPRHLPPHPPSDSRSAVEIEARWTPAPPTAAGRWRALRLSPDGLSRLTIEIDYRDWLSPRTSSPSSARTRACAPMASRCTRTRARSHDRGEIDYCWRPRARAPTEHIRGGAWAGRPGVSLGVSLLA
jgi:hypothetical protein